MRYEELCSSLLRLAENTSDLQKLRQEWIRLKPGIEILHLLQADDDSRQLIRELESAAVRFLRSLSAATGALAAEWKSIAESDVEKLRDCALALYEHLRENEREFKPAFARANALLSASLDPYSILDELRRAGAISEHTWALLRKCDRKEFESERARRQMERLAALLFELKEVERGVAKEER